MPQPPRTYLNMHNQPLAIGLISLFLGATTSAAPSPAAPLVARQGLESFWNLTTYNDQNCNGVEIQNFHGSAGVSCQIISGSPSRRSTPINLITGSVYVQTDITYDFSFYSNQECEVGDPVTLVYPVDGAQCISLGSMDPESFTVEAEVSRKKSRRSEPAFLENRQVICEGKTIWDATTFTSTDCTGDSVDTYGGNELDCPSGLNHTCIAVENSSLKSVLLESHSGTYDFTFVSDNDCVPTAINDRIYEVSTGKSLCVPLNGLQLGSISEAFVGA